MCIRRLGVLAVFSVAALACSSNRGLLSHPDAGGGGLGGGSGGAGGRGSGGGGGAPTGGAGGQLSVDAGIDTAGTDGGADAPLDASGDGSADGLPDASGDVLPDVPPLQSPMAFEAHGMLTLTPAGVSGPTGAVLPTTQDLLLYVDLVESTLIAASPGQATKVPLTTIDRVNFSTTSMLYFQVPTSLCGISLSYSSMNFAVQGAQIRGTARGTAIVIEGDVGYSYDAQLTFTGTADSHGPSVTMAVAQDVDPLYPPAFTISEPLAVATTAQLTSDADMIALEPRPGMSQVVTSFGVPAGRALRYGATYQLAIQPWRDLAGNAGATIASFTTAVAPPLVAEDGFEGAATMVGGAQIVDASVLPPITGMRSAVLVGASTPTTVAGTRHLGVRLRVQGGDTVVRFNLRPWGSYQGTLGTANLATTVAVPGGASTSKAMPGGVALSTKVMVGSNTVWLGDVIHVEIPLPSGASSEVVVDLNTYPYQTACGLQPTNASFLVDDLRVE